MFIPLKMVLIGIDPYPYVVIELPEPLNMLFIVTVGNGNIIDIAESCLVLRLNTGIYASTGKNRGITV